MVEWQLIRIKSYNLKGKNASVGDYRLEGKVCFFVRDVENLQKMIYKKGNKHAIIGKKYVLTFFGVCAIISK